MDIERIRWSAEVIQKHQNALEWLEEFGEDLAADQASFTLTIRSDWWPNHRGAADAKIMVAAFARISMEEAVAEAKQNCRETIEFHREAIGEEIK